MNTTLKPARRLSFSLAVIVAATWFVSLSAQPGRTAATAGLPCAAPGLAAPKTFGVRGRDIVVADFNGDAKPDIAGVTSDSVFVMPGDGQGSFSAAITSNTSGNPFSLAAGDFNGDGKLDLVTANRSSVSGQASILLGDGTGRFSRASVLNWTFGSTTQSNVVVADLNGDGKLDVIGSGSSLSEVFVGLGDGTGQFPTKFSSFVGGFILSLAVTDFNGDGKLDVVSAGPGSVGGFLSLLPGDGTGHFGAGTKVQLGFASSYITVADLNGDGRPDIVADGRAVLLGDGAGGFGAPKPIVTGVETEAHIAVADFDDDGKLDLAIPYSNPGGAVIMSGDGAGGFRATANYSAGGVFAVAAAAADLNADGRPDLLLSNADIGVQHLAVLPGTCAAAAPSLKFGDGTLFIFEPDAARISPVQVFVMRTGSLTGAASVNYMTSDGTATAPSDYMATSGTLNFAEGDFLKSFPLVVFDDNVTEGNETVNLTLSDAAGAAVLGSPSTVPFSISDDDPPPSVSVNDVSVKEGDFGTTNAQFTVSLSNPSAFSVAVNYATADATATAGEDYAAASGTLTFAPGETSKPLSVAVKGDTRAEINEAVFVNLSGPTNATLGRAQGVATISDDDSTCPAPSFAGHTDFAAHEFPFSLAAADFDRDGKTDLAVAHLGGNPALLLRGDGAGGFAPAGDINGGVRVTAADLNGDGKADLIFTPVSQTGPLAYVLNNGSGGFSALAFVDAGPLPFSVVTADFNGDGKLDIAAVNTSGASVTVLPGDGAGGFGAKRSFAVGTSPEFAAVGDFNGDGKADLAVSNMNSNNVSVLLGDGAGGFAASRSFAAGENPQGISAADLNGDGRLDLAVANQTSNDVSILLGDGAGGFSAAANFAAGERPISLVIADFNKDGQPDLAVTDFAQSGTSSGGVSVLFNAGNGKFAAPAGFLVGTNPAALVAADFNGDGRVDLATANVNSSDVSILLNGCAGAVPAQVQFASPSVIVNEGGGRATVTVTRTGDTSAASTVDVRTSDDARPIRCDDTTTAPGVAFARCDYATVAQTLVFSPGETSKTFSVPLVDDAFAEPNETVQLVLSNPSGATLGAQATMALTITSDDSPGAPNPIFGTDFFVRMQYLDFFGREPDAGGFDAWKRTIDNCPAGNTTCDRVSVSANFFRSKEFELKGGYVYNFYKVAFSRRPHYSEIIPDMSSLIAVDDAGFFAKKAQFTDSFVRRQEFRNLYDTLSNQQFVAALLDKYNLQQITTTNPSTPDDTAAKVTLTRSDLVGRLNGRTMTRPQVLRAVADSDEVRAAEANSSFVAMQYFGYLRRDPEEGGYNDWLRTINANPADIRSMVNGFMNSTEYRLRFGTP